MNWIDKLKTKWKLKSGVQVVLILLVFTCAGFSAMFLKQPILGLFVDGEKTLVFTVVYYILFFPFYYLLLLFYALIFGQIDFFWAFVGRSLGRFKRRKRDDVRKE